MPAPDFKLPSPIHPDTLPPFALGRAPGPDPLLHQIRLLREDIARLHRDMAPASTTIQTGRDVVAEYQRLLGSP